MRHGGTLMVFWHFQSVYAPLRPGTGTLRRAAQLCGSQADPFARRSTGWTRVCGPSFPTPISYFLAPVNSWLQGAGSNRRLWGMNPAPCHLATLRKSHCPFALREKSRTIPRAKAVIAMQIR